MSYILEAIKKADLKRKIGDIPDIHSNHDDHFSEPNHRAIWPYLLAIAFFCNAGLIAWWLQPWGDPAPSHIEEQANKPQPVTFNPANIPAHSALPISKTDVLPPVPVGIPGQSEPLVQNGKAILPQAPLMNDIAANLPTTTAPQSPAKKVTQATTPETLSERIGTVTHSLTQETTPEKTSQNKINNLPSTPAILPDTNNKPTAKIITNPAVPPLPKTDPALPPTKATQAPTPATLSERIGTVTHSLSQKTEPKKTPQNKINNLLPAPAVLAPAATKETTIILASDNNSTANLTAENKLNNQPQLGDNNTDETTENELDDSSEPETVDEPGRTVFDITKVPFLYQLPESVQKTIPEIKVSFHSYRYRPSARLVRINDHIMREGQEITKDLILEKIIPSGVVLLFENKRFRVGL